MATNKKQKAEASPEAQQAVNPGLFKSLLAHKIAEESALGNLYQGLSSGIPGYSPAENPTVGDMLSATKGYVGQHPIGTMAGIGLGLGNIGGFADNDKFGGQLAGLGLGALGAHAMGGLSNPGAAAILTLGGGELGALFDKLRAKREGQRRQIAQQQQMRR